MSAVAAAPSSPEPFVTPAAKVPESLPTAANDAVITDVPASPVAAANETPARTEVKPPEQTAAAEQAAVMPPPPRLPIPTPTTVESLVPSSAHLVVMPNVLKKAEENLASYLGSVIQPASLTEGLVLTLSGAAVKGATDVKLCLDGPMVGANAALLGGQVVAALKSLPVFAPLFDGSHTPHAQSPQGLPTMVHVHIPQLSIAQYAQLIQSLAAGITHAAGAVVTSISDTPLPATEQADIAAVTPATGHVCSSADCNHGHASAPAKAATTDATASDANPSTHVENPAAAHGVVAANNTHMKVGA